MVNRDVVGIITKIDDERGNVEQVKKWLELAGCKTVFCVNSKTGEGVEKILEYLREPGDIMPWEISN